MPLILIIWIGCAIAASTIASAKGRSGLGFGCLSLLLGPIGVLGAALAAGDRTRIERAELKAGRLRRCPSCAEPVLNEAIRCRHCGEPLPPVATPTPSLLRWLLFGGPR